MIASWRTIVVSFDMLEVFWECEILVVTELDVGTASRNESMRNFGRNCELDSCGIWECRTGGLVIVL